MGGFFMSKMYRELEDHIISTFNNERIFHYREKQYSVIVATKPRPSSGECKTDVYVLLKDENNKKYEVKISVKRKGNNEFQENKVTAKKAEAYFGATWQSIISRAAYSIQDRFESRPLIYQSGKHPTKPKIPNSGIASYLLATEINDIHSVNDILNQMQYIDNMVLRDIYLIFTANNYRTDVDSADGPRALAVSINWKCINSRLTPEFEYKRPLAYTGEGDMKPILLLALDQLGKRHPEQFDRNNDVCCSDIILP